MSDILGVSYLPPLPFSVRNYAQIHDEERARKSLDVSRAGLLEWDHVGWVLGQEAVFPEGTFEEGRVECECEAVKRVG